MPAKCEMVVGFLVPHQCDNAALGHCRKCSRGFCDEHMRIESAGLLCLACEQGFDRPVMLASSALVFTPTDINTFSAAGTVDDHEPLDTFSDLS